MTTRTGWPRVPAWAPAVVLLGMLIAVLGTGHVPVSGDERSGGPLASTLAAVAVLAAGAALVVPRTATVVVAGALAAYFARGYPDGPILGAGLALMFILGRRTDRVTPIGGLAVIEAGMLVGWGISGHGGATVLFYPGWAAAAAAVGAAVRNRRGYLRQQRAVAESAERTRVEEALRLAAEDRLRIARDLHDGVAHAMATINVQAAAAARVLDRQPAAARDALTAIARASGTVLDELNAMLTLLRDPSEPAARTPAPGLGDLDALAATVRDAGRQCRVRADGPLDGVAPAIATAAYRIVQESLTNILKHSTAQHVAVDLCVDGDRFAVTVTDDGTVRPSFGAGNGIRGMRERAESTGGAFTADFTENGFTVRAEWPAP